MASIHDYPTRNTHRIFYRLKIGGKLVGKSKYAKQLSTANLLKTRLERIEAATRTGMATMQEIGEWIQHGWIKSQEAGLAFPGYEESAERSAGTEISRTDYPAILEAYEDYAADKSKGGEGRKTHRNHVGMAKKVLSWLKLDFPDLHQLDEDAIIKHLRLLKDSYTEWTVYHYLTKLRLLLDQAMKLGMIQSNPAREIQLGQPKKSKTRRILTEEEARELLETTLSYQSRELINGCLPVVVRLGLYAGLRNEEMCWLRWDAIDWKNRILSIQEAVCEESGELWKPKDSEARRIDVKQPCIDFLREDQKRQKKQGMLSPFVLPGGHWKKTQYRRRPLTQEVPQKAFSRMIKAEKLDTRITLYTLRHTYATMALRAGIDLRTLQQRMGHADLKTTMEYLHYIEPEAHPMDRLPY